MRPASTRRSRCRSVSSRRLPTAPPGRPQRGFTLLEALVALTLIATSGLVLMAWINTNLQSIGRLQQRDAEAHLKLAATQIMQTVNPLVQPEGSLRAGTLEVRWRTTALTPRTTSMGFTGAGQGRFAMQLFEAQVEARDVDLGTELSFVATLLGYRGLPGVVNEPR